MPEGTHRGVRAWCSVAGAKASIFRGGTNSVPVFLVQFIDLVPVGRPGLLKQANVFKEFFDPKGSAYRNPGGYATNVTSNAPVRLRMRPTAVSIFPSARMGQYIQYFRPTAASARQDSLARAADTRMG